MKYAIIADPTSKYLHKKILISIDKMHAADVTFTNNLVFPCARTNAFPGVVCI